MRDQFIGHIAKQALVPVKTIRYYEERGLLLKPERTVSGYRLYRPEMVDRLQFIKKAKALGLQLDEIKEILELADRGRCPCGHVQHTLKTRLGELRQKIRDLQTLEARIQGAIRRNCPSNFTPKGRAICPTIQGPNRAKERR